MSEIIYRDAKVEDAEKIVAFYNYVGGETSYLSFEKDEYPMTVSEQEDEIRSLEGNQTNRMLLAMDERRLQELRQFIPHTKSKPRHDGELGIVVAKKYQKQESEAD